MTSEPDQRLLSGILRFVAEHPHPDVARFKPAVANWGDEWRAVPARSLPAAATLRQTLDLTTDETRPLVELFEDEGDAKVGAELHQDR